MRCLGWLKLSVLFVVVPLLYDLCCVEAQERGLSMFYILWLSIKPGAGNGGRVWRMGKGMRNEPGNAFGECFRGMVSGNGFGEWFRGMALGNTFGEWFQGMIFGEWFRGWFRGMVLGNGFGKWFRGMDSGNSFGECFRGMVPGNGFGEWPQTPKPGTQNVPYRQRSIFQKTCQKSNFCSRAFL